MAGPTGRAFNEWLKAQLKAKKMSQRQLAQQSGVDHSTISRLIHGDRMPSLGTANPTARVEYALRADDLLSEPQVRQVMEYYLAVRMRRFARGYSSIRPSDRPMEPRRLLDDRRDSPVLSAAMAGRAVRPLLRPLPPRVRTGRDAG